MSSGNIIEKFIQDALGCGEFDNLPGKGTPLDLTPYFNILDDLRMKYLVLKSNQIVPAKVDLIREIADLETEISEEKAETAKRVSSRKLNDKTLALDLALARRKRRR